MYLDGTNSCLELDPDESAWIQADNTIIILISATLSDSTLSTIIGCKFSAKMRDMLQEYFFRQSNANCTYYKTKLANFKSGSRSTSEYLQEAKFLLDALANIGDHIPDKDLIQIVLHGLGDGYDMLVTSIELQPVLPKFSVLWAHLFLFNAQFTTSSQASQSSSSTTLMAS